MQAAVFGAVFRVVVGGGLCLALWGCGGSKSLPYPGTGLSINNDQLVWELTVGVLNARDFPRINRRQADLFLGQVSADLKRRLPGLQVRFILDQPLDAPFMMERLIRKKDRLTARYGPHTPVLLLEGGTASRDLNRKKALAFGLKAPQVDSILKKMEFLREIRLPGSENPILTDRMVSSDLVWREFLRQQVRYDLVLTNAFIFPDDLRVPARFTGPGGGVRLRIGRAEGRTGMEGLAAYISLYNHRGKNPDGVHIRDLQAVLLALLLPGSPTAFASADGAPLPAGTGAEKLPDCPGCPEHWKRRLAYLKGVAHINRANFEAGCPLLRANRPTKMAPARAPSLNPLLKRGPEARKLEQRNHGLLLRKCPRP